MSLQTSFFLSIKQALLPCFVHDMPSLPLFLPIPFSSPPHFSRLPTSPPSSSCRLLSILPCPLPSALCLVSVICLLFFFAHLPPSSPSLQAWLWYAACNEEMTYQVMHEGGGGGGGGFFSGMAPARKEFSLSIYLSFFSVPPLSLPFFLISWICLSRD